MARRTKTKAQKSEPIRVIFRITKWDPDFYCRYFRSSKNLPVSSLVGHHMHVGGTVIYPADRVGLAVDLRFLRVRRDVVGDPETKSVGEMALRTDEHDRPELSGYVRVDDDTNVALLASIGVRAHSHGVIVLQPMPRSEFRVSEVELCAELDKRDVALVEGRAPAEPE